MQTGSYWLDDYASSRFQWQHAPFEKANRFYRPLGLVEYAFDADGRYHEGRADMTVETELDVKSTLGREALRRRTLLAWACLRCRYPLLQAKALPNGQAVQDPDARETEIYFVIDVPATKEDAVVEAEEYAVFLEDYYENIDPYDFWFHGQNVARVVDPEKSLAKFFVLPLERISVDRSRLRFVTIGSHQIWDGLTMHVFQRELVHFINKELDELESQLTRLVDIADMNKRLPLPQEAFYPPITGSKARRRWFWIITCILLHVRKPLEAGFANPLRRHQPLPPVSLSPVYGRVLDYSRTPPLNTRHVPIRIPLRNTQRLHRLCREAKASIGAGCFALSALSMMEMEELLHPNIPLSERKPFISGFPLDPRAFFNYRTDPDSLMLAFCDGISLPFLPSTLDLGGRIRLLTKQAHRQLAAFQKRKQPADSEAKLEYMGTRGAGRMLANLYISGVSRIDAVLPESLRRGLEVQTAYPPRPNMSVQTCGVSSVGWRGAVIWRGMYDLDVEGKAFVADFRDLR
jgi:hypothetical protein